MRMIAADDKAVAEVAAVLLGGGVAVLPTDTVYGIAAHPGCAAALARICAVKGRAPEKPVALLAADGAAVRRFGAAVPAAAERLAAAFWPGALTLVLPCGGDAAYEGFRVPDYGFTRAVLAACGGCLRVTSANLSGAVPALDAVTALREVGLEADLVVDGGLSPGGVASTVVRVSAGGAVEVLREGAVPAAEVLRVAGNGN